METLRALMVILSLLSSLTQVLSSNPDSVGVQDSSDDSDKRDQKTSAPLLTPESRGRSISSYTQSNPSMPMNRVQPFIIDRVRHSGLLGTSTSQRYDSRNARPDFVVSAGEMTTKANEEGATSRSQNESVSRESSTDVTGLNRRTDTNDGEAGSSSGGLRYRDGSKNTPEEFPDCTNCGYSNGVKRPKVEQVPSDLDADTRGQNERGTPNYRPDLFNSSSSSGYGGRGTSEDRSLSLIYWTSSTGQRVPSSLQPDTSEQGGRRTSEDIPASFNPLSSSGYGGRGTSDDHPLSLRPTSNVQRFPSGLQPDTSEQGGKKTSDDRPATFNPRSSSGYGGRVTWEDRLRLFGPSSTIQRVPSGLQPDTSEQGGRRTSDDRRASFNLSSPSGYGGRGTSEDRPLPFRPSSTIQRIPSGLQPDTSEQGGRKTSDDRRASFNPSSSASPSNEKFDPDASKDSEEFWNFPEIRPPPPLRECTAKRRMSQDSYHLSGVINNFAFKLIDTLKLETNFVISPLSIFIALSMCYLGSDGATRSELENALGLDNSLFGMQLHKGIKDLLPLVLPRSGEYDLQIANGMFLGRNFTTNEEFDRNIQEFYAAELKNLDFENPELSMSVINEWVSRATKNMITSLTDVPPPALTRLLLINAMYFKGLWKTQFPPNKTYDGRFTNSDGNTRMVPTMPLYEETFPFLMSDKLGHSFIKLPYEGDQVSMIIALPYTAREKPMPTVTDDILCSVRDEMANRKLDSVTIPRFRLEYSRFLRQPLGRMGLSHLFNPNTKDLSKMRKKNDVYVSAVLHKAVIEVNERGTTASASTALELVPLTLKKTTDFDANHNFAFYVLHEPSGLVLFYGKIYSLNAGSDAFQENRRQATRARPTSSIRRKPSEAPRNNRVRLHGAVTYEYKK